MQKGCSDILEAKIAERNEKAKKLYRYVSDVARRVDEATTACRSLNDLFSTKIEILRQKLRENCEKLLFLDPSNYGKKSLELLWRKGYYEAVSASRKLQEPDNDNASDNCLFTHIICGIGHFHHIITRIQTSMKILPGELDYEPILDDWESEETLETEESNEDIQFGRYVLYQCLIYLGDLSRYQVEILHNFEPSTAARYYLQAAHIDMCSGMPFNQLGNLYLDKNYNLDSVCYYIHCLACNTPFEGAMGNLVKILEKQTQYCETLNDTESYTQAEHIQNTVANFLSLIEIWYSSKNDTNVPQRCNRIAHDLKIAMDFAKSPLPDINKDYEEYIQAVEEENTNPSYLNGNLVHKVVQICLFTVSKMVEIDEQKAFASKAFTLALLSQLLQKLLKQLEDLGLKNPARKYRSRTLSVKNVESKKIKTQTETQDNNEVAEHLIENKPLTPIDTEINETKLTMTDDETKKLQNGDGKLTPKKAVAKRRRRRRVASSESSDLSDADTESSEVTTDDACSDEEVLSDSTNKSDDNSESEGSICIDSDGEDIEDNHEDIEKKVKSPPPNENIKVNGIDHNSLNKEDSVEVNMNEENPLKEEEIQNFLLGDNFLPSIKLLLDWVLLEKDLILSCGDSGESLFQCVVDLLNIFSFYFDPNNSETNSQCTILDYANYISKKLKLEYKKIPLPEDLNLRGTNICKFDKDAAEWQILGSYKPSVYEENVIRILNFIDFGNQIAKIVPRIRFNRTMKIFYFKKTTAPKLNTKINHKRSREWHNSKTPHVETGEGGLLRRLGRLWLTSQVRELERSGRATGPALLALDAAALHSHLRRVKQLLRARSFVLLVPTVVLQELDDLKREKSGARDAIRWLEAQLRSGSRFLRAQRPGQSRPLPLLKYPKKAPPHVNNFIQILEFCHHLTADEKPTHVGQGEPERHGKSTPLLILLVGSEPGDGEYKEFSLTGAAQAAGISIECIGDFYTKWRQVVHKSGKKR